MLDLAGQTTGVSDACGMAGLDGLALWVQLGGRMHQARAQALKAKSCIVDDGDGAEHLAHAIDEALTAATPEEAMARVVARFKGQQPHCGATRTWGRG